MFIGCICGGPLDVIVAITFGGVLIGWAKKIVHKIRCKCSCHSHVCKKDGDRQ